MDKVIKRILEIDQRAVDIKNEAEEIIKLKDKELEERLLSIEQDNMKKAEARGNMEYQRIMNEGKREAENILKRGEQKIKALEDAFEKKFDKLQAKIFEKLFTVEE